MTQPTDVPTVANLAFVEALYDQYLADPGSVSVEWAPCSTPPRSQANR